MITQRQQVSLLVRRELIERAQDFYMILDDVSITELSFGKEYAAAVEAKQVAQQEAQRAQFTVEQAKQERQQKIVQAEGEAEAAKMISFSFKNLFFFTIISPDDDLRQSNYCFKNDRVCNLSTKKVFNLMRDSFSAVKGRPKHLIN